MATENELLTEVERLRSQFPHTQTLYRELAALLFFRYDTTPTANRLYQLVRKGSMSAPADALRQFWADLREKSQVRMDHADIPDELKESAGQLIGQLWTGAQAAAQQSYLAYQAQADELVQQAQHQLQLSEATCREQEHQLQQEKNQTQALAAHIEHLTQALTQAQREADQLRQEIVSLKSENKHLDAQMHSQSARFTDELQRIQEAMALSEERARSSEKRALLEIDRERLAQQELKKQLADVAGKLAQAQEDQQQLGRTKEQEIAVLMQQIGQLEGQQKAHQAALDFSHNLGREMQTELQLLRTRSALLQQEQQHAAQTIARLRKELDAARQPRARVALMRKPIA